MIKEVRFEWEELLPIVDAEGEIEGYKDIVLQCTLEYRDSYNFGGEYDGQELRLVNVSWEGEDYTNAEKVLIKQWVRDNWDDIICEL
jgi:hypothetical protein